MTMPSNKAPAPNRRPRFSLGSLGEFGYLVCAPSASPAAVSEAQRWGHIMKNLTLCVICTLATALTSGCKSTRGFEPQWLPQSAQLTYSTEYEGNVRAKVKARVTEADFATAVRALKLIPYTEDQEYSQHADHLNWKRGPDKRWDPSPDVERTLISHHYNWWEIVKYENGFLYYSLVDTEGR